MRQRNQPLHVVLLPQKANVFGDFQFASQMLGRAAIGAIADHQEMGGHLFSNFRKNADAIQHALDRAEIRHVDQEFFRRLGA